MTIAFDAETGFVDAAGSTADLSGTHTPVGTPRGVFGLQVLGFGGRTTEFVGATYGGVSMTHMPGSPFEKTTSESGAVAIYFLGASIPTGAQTITFDNDGTNRIKLGACITVTAAADCEVIDTTPGNSISSDSLADPSGTLALGGSEAYCVQAGFSGRPNAGSASPLTNWTRTTSNDEGSQVQLIDRYDLIGTTDVTFGYNYFGTPDDVGLLAGAIREVAASAGSFSALHRTILNSLGVA